MNPENNREEQLFRDALARPAGPERKAFLDGACGNDSALRQRLDALLRAHENPDSALATAAEAPRLRAEATARQAGPAIKLSFPEDPAPIEGPGTVIGRYRILEQIGEGGFGAVYVAEQREPVKRRVALKVIKLGMDTRQVVARFEAERQALAMMDHPNIAKVLDAGATETGRPYFVMELVRGIPITAYCDENALDTQQRLGLFIQVCQAVQHAHQKGIIHRDLKPSNILVTLHDGVPVPMVIDFGIAKAMHGELTDKTVYTQFQQFIGTPAYVSPEQAEMSALDIDTRADIYSLGVLLYELLTGRVPFEAKELLEAGVDEMRRILREREPARPSTRLGKMTAEELTTTAKRRGAAAPKLISVLRGDLDWVVMKCLEKDRTRRYESASNLANDIQHHLASEPVAARPPSKAYRFQKAWRRNRLAFTAGATVVAALVVGIGISAWQAVVATRARTKAVAAQQEAERAQGAEKQARLRADAEKTESARNFYVASMRLAQQAWEDNNIGRLREVLDDTKESPFRGFEWYFWNRQTHLAAKTLRGHLGGVFSVAFSPDAQRIVTGGFDRVAKVWDAASGRELFGLTGHQHIITCVAFSPDGRQIGTGSYDGTAKLWVAATGKEFLTLRARRGLIDAVAFSPDGRGIVVANQDGTATLWDTTTGQELRTLRVCSENFGRIAFSPDGRCIITPGANNDAKVWELATGRELLTLRGHSNQVNSVAFSPDGKRILTSSHDWSVMVWDAATGQQLLTLKGHVGEVLTARFSPDSRRIVTGSTDRTARMWDSATGRELFALKGHSADVYAAAFSPDGQWVLTASRDETAKIWDVEDDLSPQRTGERPLVLKGHTNGLVCTACSTDRQHIVTASYEGSVKVWDFATGRELSTFAQPSNALSFLAISPDGRRVLAATPDRTIRIWEATTGRELVSFRGSRGVVSAGAFSPDGQRVAVVGSDHRAKIWDASSGQELVVLKGNEPGIWSIAFSPSGEQVVTGSLDGTAKVWAVATGQAQLTLKGHNLIQCVAFSLDGRRVVTGSEDGTATVWDVTTGRELFTLKGHNGMIMSVAFSPDGQRIVTGSYDKTAKLWETTSGREMLTLKGHSDALYSVAFSSDQRRILTGSGDKTARVWEVAGVEQAARWRNEEHAAAKSLVGFENEWNATQERQSALHSRACIRQWLVLGPAVSVTNGNGVAPLYTEQVTGESRLRPRLGQTSSFGGVQMEWREMIVDDPGNGFTVISNAADAQAVAYGVCYLRSEVDRSRVQMLVSPRNISTVYLNGVEAYTLPLPRDGLLAGLDSTDVSLKAGLNVLVYKVVRTVADWEGSSEVWRDAISFADRGGNPIQGQQVTLNPEVGGASSGRNP